MSKRPTVEYDYAAFDEYIIDLHHELRRNMGWLVTITGVIIA